jgi:hypothetical protein
MNLKATLDMLNDRVSTGPGAGFSVADDDIRKPGPAPRIAITTVFVLTAPVF